jgi:hypothetical protein
MKYTDRDCARELKQAGITRLKESAPGQGANTNRPQDRSPRQRVDRESTSNGNDLK